MGIYYIYSHIINFFIDYKNNHFSFTYTEWIALPITLQSLLTIFNRYIKEIENANRT